MLITEKLIIDGMSGNGGWNKQQIELLGLKWPMPNGWKRLVIGRSIAQVDAERFIALKGKSQKKARALRQQATDTNAMKALEARVRILERQVDALFVHLEKS